MNRPAEVPEASGLRRRRRSRSGIALRLALLLPLAVPAGWLSLELRAAHDRAAALLAAGVDHTGRALGDLLGRFDRIATGLRLPESPADTMALTARLLRLEPQLAPATTLLVMDAQGRLLASSHPLGGATLDAAAAAWFQAAIAAPADPVLTAAPAPPPFGGPDAYAIAHRLNGPQGDAAGVIVTFLPAAALRRVIEPGWLARRGAAIRLTDVVSGRAVLDLAAADATAAPIPPAAAWLAVLRGLAAMLADAPVATAAISIAPGNLNWQATLDPWALLAADAAGLRRRGVWAIGLALVLALSTALALAHAWRGGRGHRTTPSQAATVPVAGPPAAPPGSGEAGCQQHSVNAAETERDRVLAAIGHDVRTPLNSILGIAALLLDGGLEAAQRRWVERIRASCELLLAMLNGMLEACSAHVDGAELNADDVDVAGLVREVCEVLRPQAHDKGLDLRIAVEDATLGAWRTDPTRVRQVLFNLAGNAIKYTDHGAVEVRVSLAATHEGREVFRVQVTDTGPGIAPEERVRIFERFQRGGGPATAGREGIGLGLSLCRDIASLMGGALRLESTPGLGSLFTFEFPAERSPVGGRRGAPFPGRSALVIGLSEGVRRRLALHLQGLGFVVETAGDGFVGLGLAERTAAMQGALDLVVLDGALTGLPAEAVLHRLRASRQLEAARVIWVAHADAAPRAPAPVDAVVPHPAEPREIEQAVGALLGASSVLQAADPEAPAPAEGRILVVEDNKINQALFADVLGRAGFSVFTANDGEEAIHAARRGGFDLILMDIQMPGIDGIEATRRIRTAEAGGCWRTPVVALTAHTGSLVRRQCLEAGASAVLHKPVNLSQLPLQLRGVIASNRAEAAALGAAAGSAATLPAEAAGDGAAIEIEYLEALIFEMGPARAREVVREFLADTGTRLPRLEELLASAEWSAVQRSCHDMAGLAGTFGAVSLAEALAALGHAAREQDAARAEQVMAEVTAAWDRSRLALLRGVEAALPGHGGTRQGRAA